MVNNQLISLDEAMDFKYDENSLVLDFYAINYQLEGNINYRYKINDSDWIILNDNHLTLLDLEPKEYRISLQAQNEDNIWSQSLVIPFTIHHPWWKTFWFIGAMILLATAITYLIMKRNFRIKKKLRDIETEIQSLEKSALKAQMNPHFIFNSLNSIQSYIMKNDRTQAMDYLSMFARLIRMNLNALNSDRITIEEEKKMLEDYLDLEQMRFEGKFDYKINLAPTIDPIKMTIPPMLIQPVVENAVLHGMIKRKSKGEIQIFFEKVSHGMDVIIKDNGVWIKDDKSKKIHKSYGLDITRKRLALQKKEGVSKEANFELKVEDGWTIVRLSIQLS
jgi:LytS/YehU family sensor histidine kinase